MAGRKTSRTSDPSGRPRHDGPQKERENRPPGNAQRLVVKFRDDIMLPYDGTARNRLDELYGGFWHALTQQFPGLNLRPLFTAAAPDRIRQLVDQAVHLDPAYRPPNFFTYFLIDVVEQIDPQALVKSLRQRATVQYAYLDPQGIEPSVNAADDPRASGQGHLDMAPAGIDARFAWGFAGGDGAGQQFVDLEQGWVFNHEDLVAQGPTLIFGTMRDDSRPHGTSVLAVVCASDNSVGGLGVAPHLASVKTVSHYGNPRADAILAAVDCLSFGAVLLLEVQADPDLGSAWRPIEVFPADFAMIRLATALGITVVEPAGNGVFDLDTFLDSNGKAVLNRSSGDFADSGAIMVGAANSEVPHTRWVTSNFGNRIDCYAWGQHVDTATTTTTAPFPTTNYTADFQGTSSAAAIIAGAALALQGIAQANLGSRLSSGQLRVLLTEAATGTPSNSPPNDKIGIMPDLRAILSSDRIGLVPDVYLRDFVGDTGDVHSGAISASPDIILRTASVANPQSAFGEGSGTENSDSLGSSAEAGHDNFIYVRVRNRKGLPASAVTVTVYWSPPATLVTSDLWTLVGSTILPTVPAGNLLTVSNAIVWPAAKIPTSGHYCFIGLVGNAFDPAPAPADFLDLDHFQQFIRNNNNVSWRNFNVVASLPPPGAEPAGFVELPFLSPGAPDKARRMQLEVVSRLPVGSKVLLEMPLGLFYRLTERPPAEIDKKREAARIPVNPIGTQRLGEALFPAGSRHALRLLVQVPVKFRQNPYELWVRQLLDGRELGRVTWRLAGAAAARGGGRRLDRSPPRPRD